MFPINHTALTWVTQIDGNAKALKPLQYKNGPPGKGRPFSRLTGGAKQE